MLDLVAEADEELQVGTDRIVRVRPSLANAFPKFPALGLTIDTFKAPWIIASPVSVIEVVPRELGVQQVQPGKVHVHHETLERADLSRIVVEADSETGFVSRGLDHRPVFSAACHQPSCARRPG